MSYLVVYPESDIKENYSYYNSNSNKNDLIGQAKLNVNGGYEIPAQTDLKEINGNYYFAGDND